MPADRRYAESQASSDLLIAEAFADARDHLFLTWRQPAGSRRRRRPLGAIAAVRLVDLEGWDRDFLCNLDFSASHTKTGQLCGHLFGNGAKRDSLGGVDAVAAAAIPARVTHARPEVTEKDHVV